MSESWIDIEGIFLAQVIEMILELGNRVERNDRIFISEYTEDWTFEFRKLRNIISKTSVIYDSSIDGIRKRDVE